MEDRTCTTCGSKPSLGLDAPGPVSSPVSSPGSFQAARIDQQPEQVDRKRTERRRKPSYFIAKLVIIWFTVMALIIVGVRLIWEEPEQTRNAPAKSPDKPTVSSQDLVNLDKAIPLMSESLQGFLSATVPEERNQFVRAPVDTAAKMARFNRLNPIVNIPSGGLVLKERNHLPLPGNQKAISVLWGLADGRTIDTVMFEENGEWLLDWEHYVRYSDYPWSQFLSGGGEPEGEFRLLARERLAEERKNADTISLFLYAPRFGNGNATGFQSPEFVVRRASKEGKLLDAAFKLQRAGKQPYGLRVTGGNQDDLIRVRLKIRRVTDGDKQHYEIARVIACHWYSIDDVGVELPKETDQE